MESVLKTKRILVIGDSLAMPRVEDGVTYESTYTYLLKKMFPMCEIICRAARGNDSKKQSSNQALYDDIEVFSPDVVIMHLGIVDCAPRLFSKKQAFVLKLLPYAITSRIIKFCSKYRYLITKLFPKVYVSKELFDSSLKKIFSAFEKINCSVICISIASTSEKNANKSFGIVENIKTYNEILKLHCLNTNSLYVNFYDETKNNDFLLDDGIHINIKGHEFLSLEISRLLSKDESM